MTRRRRVRVVPTDASHRARLAATVGALAVACACSQPTPEHPDAEGGSSDAAPIADAQGDGGVTAGAWTVVVLPDTQILARDHPAIFDAQTQWILEARERLDIQFVLHVGDVVDGNVPSEWDVAAGALHRLDGRVPYVLAPGNHDLGPGGSASDRETMLGAYFPISTYEAWPSFRGTFAPGSIENSYHVFQTPAGPWLVVALEFGPRDEVVAWADAVVRAHGATPSIVVTHAYLYSDDTRYDHATRPDQMWSPYSYGLAALPGGVNDGEEMFDALVRTNDAIDLVVCGHVLNDGVGRLTSTQDGGGRVHQLLANYQEEPEGGAGFLRIMTFDLAGTRVEVSTYSPYLDEWRSGPDDAFSLGL